VQDSGSRFLFAAMVKVLRMGRLVDRARARGIWGVDRVTSNRTMRAVRIADTALSFGPTPLSTQLLLVFCFHSGFAQCSAVSISGTRFSISRKGLCGPASSKRLHHQITSPPYKPNTTEYNTINTVQHPHPILTIFV
jgi:hypothetical protein